MSEPIQSHQHVQAAASVKGLRADIAKIEGFNAKLAVALTNGVGTMGCAYAFCLLALVSLPAILTDAGWVHFFPHWAIAPGLVLIVAWVAQTFIQLVLLSVIMVGQGVQSRAADARAISTFDDTVLILDRLDHTTQGGIQVLHEQLTQLLER